MNGGDGWVNDKAVPLLRGAPPQVRERGHDNGHAVDIDETSEECKPASVERIVPKREKDHVVVNLKPLVRRAGASGNAREGSQPDILVLSADPDPSHVALIGILPDADRELLRFLDVERAGKAGDRRVKGAERTASQILIGASVIDEGRIAPAALCPGDGPRIGVGLILAIIRIDIIASERMGYRAHQEAQLGNRGKRTVWPDDGIRQLA